MGDRLVCERCEVKCKNIEIHYLYLFMQIKKLYFAFGELFEQQPVSSSDDGIFVNPFASRSYYLHKRRSKRCF